MDLSELKTQKDWKNIYEKSETKPVLIFKHSTTCPISGEAWNAFQAYLKQSPNHEIEYAFVKVIESRPVSNQITEDIGVKHESPQVILIKGRKETWNTSHWDITQKKLENALN